MTRFEIYLKHRKHLHPTRFDDRNLDPRFVEFYNNGYRVKVETRGIILTGTIGATTGWRPCFLLMRTSRSIGSPWILGPKDKILGVKKPGERCFRPA